MLLLLIMSCLSFCIPNNNPTWDNTVPYVPKIGKALVIKVYDGDTITIAHKMSVFDRKYYRFSVRLARIDCPELRTKNPVEKEYATKAKLELEKLILNKTVELKVFKTDKYGRLLAEVYFKNKSLNSWLLHNHLAVEYDGTKKTSPSNWGDYYQEIDFCSFENFNHTNT